MSEFNVQMTGLIIEMIENEPVHCRIDDASTVIFRNLNSIAATEDATAISVSGEDQIHFSEDFEYLNYLFNSKDNMFYYYIYSVTLIALVRDKIPRKSK